MKEDLHIPVGIEGFATPVRSTQVRHGLPHRHDELEVNLVLSGTAAYLFGRERLPLVAGSMVWLFPRQEHVLIDCSADFSLWVVVFTQGLVERHTLQPRRRILRAPDPGSLFCRQLDCRDVDALGHVYQNAEVGANDPEFANTALAYALAASWQAFQFSPDPIAPTDVHPAVAKAVYILRETEGAMPLPELARAAGLSASRLSRLFKEQTHVSLTAFRQRQCLERFLRIYRSGARCSLTEAAFQAGFGSYVQFHRVFRSQMGKSPAEYGRSMKEERERGRRGDREMSSAGL